MAAPSVLFASFRKQLRGFSAFPHTSANAKRLDGSPVSPVGAKPEYANGGGGGQGQRIGLVALVYPHGDADLAKRLRQSGGLVAEDQRPGLSATVPQLRQRDGAVCHKGIELPPARRSL